jgi:hypothetical protein
VFSLPEWKIKWSLDSTVPAIRCNITPIAVGRSCIYTLHKISNNSPLRSFIEAVNIDTGATMFTTHVGHCPRKGLRPSGYNIIRSPDRDYIVWSCDTLEGRERGIGFIVIDGDTGSIINQWTYITTSGHRGSHHTRAASDPDEFLISHERTDNELENSSVYQHTSFQLSKNQIQKAAVKVIVNARKESLFHPSLPHGIRTGPAGAHNIYMITIARRDSCQHSHSKTPVESIYYVESETRITNPTDTYLTLDHNKEAGSPALWNGGVPGHEQSWPLVLDENRFGVEVREVYFGKRVLIFDFAAPW